MDEGCSIVEVARLPTRGKSLRAAARARAGTKKGTPDQIRCALLPSAHHRSPRAVPARERNERQRFVGAMRLPSSSGTHS